MCIRDRQEIGGPGFPCVQLHPGEPVQLPVQPGEQGQLLLAEGLGPLAADEQEARFQARDARHVQGAALVALGGILGLGQAPGLGTRATLHQGGKAVRRVLEHQKPHSLSLIHI